jgi:hypothetical protein
VGRRVKQLEANGVVVEGVGENRKTNLITVVNTKQWRGRFK